MADRRSFLGAVSGATASVLLAARAGAQTPAPSTQAPAPVAPPASSPHPPAVRAAAASALAAATAAAMRRFDARLSDAQIDTIAHAIDANRRGAAALNAHRATALKNGDEPVTRFAAARPR